MEQGIMELKTQYIQAQDLRWADSTKRSEIYRLKSIAAGELQDPAAYYRRRKSEAVGAYSIKTEFIRIGEFYSWLQDEGHLDSTVANPWKAYVKTHAKLFKHAYKTEVLEVDYTEALKRIASIGRPEIREKAYQLLASGMRFTESRTLTRGRVIGKGGKQRPVFMPDDLHDIAFEFSYETFRRELKKVGLKPHSLRKLAATEFRRNGASAADLLRLLGWESMQTASRYEQAHGDAQLTQFATDVFTRPK